MLNICSAALAKIKKGKDPIGFSRKAKAKRKLFLIVGLEARSQQMIAVHDLKVVAI